MSLPTVHRYLPQHADRLMKLAMGTSTQQQPGKMEKYLPWYGSAGLGAAGAYAGGKFMPAKYKLLGNVGGALLGAAAGVHGGEAIGRRLDKTAEAKKKERSMLRAIKPWAQGIAGFGLGSAAGYGGIKATDYFLRRAGQPGVTPGAMGYIVPAATGALGTMYGLWKAKEQEAMRRAVEGEDEESEP